MAWSISITPEGWQNIRKELETWHSDRIIDALADDEYEAVEDENRARPADEFVNPADAHAKKRATLDKLDHSDLVDAAMDAIENNNTCDNGGFRYWIDREGYHGVTLS